MGNHGDNLTTLEKLVLHQTKQQNKNFKMLQNEILELRRAVTAGNVVDRLAQLAGERRDPIKAIADEADDWRNL